MLSGIVVSVLLLLVSYVEGHGRLRQPPARGTMWRDGFHTPKNYNDNQLFCGGSYHQNKLGGKCGMCGDAFDQPTPRENEDGGTYGKQIISETYSNGSVIEVKIEITAAHRGWFEFRLCPLSATQKETQDCLDRYLLQQQNGQTRYDADKPAQTHKIMLQLPQAVLCDQCVLQWKYHTGNSWGKDENGTGIGYGPQEEFYGCADVKITADGPPVIEEEHTDAADTTDDEEMTQIPNSNSQTENDVLCLAANAWKGQYDMNVWCQNNCVTYKTHNCPETHCACFVETGAGQGGQNEVQDDPAAEDTDSEDDDNAASEEEICRYRGMDRMPEHDVMCKTICSLSEEMCNPDLCYCYQPCPRFVAYGDGISGDPNINLYCEMECQYGKEDCPWNVCTCDTTATRLSCQGIGKFANFKGFAQYCDTLCNSGMCPDECYCA